MPSSRSRARRPRRTVEKRRVRARRCVQLTLERYDQGEAPTSCASSSWPSRRRSPSTSAPSERFAQVPDLAAAGLPARALEEEEERINLREAEINQENAESDLQMLAPTPTRWSSSSSRSTVKDAERDLATRARRPTSTSRRSSPRHPARARCSSTKTRARPAAAPELGYMTVVAPSARHRALRRSGRAPGTATNVKVGSQFHQGNDHVHAPGPLARCRCWSRCTKPTSTWSSSGRRCSSRSSRAKGESFHGKITEIASVASCRLDATRPTRPSASRSRWTRSTTRAARRDHRQGRDPGRDASRTCCRSRSTPSSPRPASTSASCRERRPATSEREVQIGKNNAHYVRSSSQGLEEGEQVLLIRSAPASVGTDRDGTTPEEAEADERRPRARFRSRAPSAVMTHGRRAPRHRQGVYGRRAPAARPARHRPRDPATGEFVGIVGASGSGKTTLLNILGCLDRPTRGQLPARWPRRLGARRRRAVARAQPLDRLRLPVLPARSRSSRCSRTSSCRCSTRRTPRAPSRRARCARAARRRGPLTACAHYPAAALGRRVPARGHRARAGQRPALLLADEPTGNLDSTNGDEVHASSSASCTARGRTIVMVTHNPEIAASLPRVVEMRDGRIDPGASASARAALSDRSSSVPTSAAARAAQPARATSCARS